MSKCRGEIFIGIVDDLSRRTNGRVSTRSISAPCTFVISTRSRNETWLITLTLTNCTKEETRGRDSNCVFKLQFFFLHQLSYLVGKKDFENLYLAFMIVLGVDRV